jgi:hypothetical protein
VFQNLNTQEPIPFLTQKEGQVSWHKTNAHLTEKWTTWPIVDHKQLSPFPP